MNILSIDAFYISATEVTNASYREFCKEKGHQYLPDTTVWRMPMGFDEPLVKYYFRHPAYNNYPVVGVTRDQANAYCEWLTEKVSGILDKYPELKEELDLSPFRLPTSFEWECAVKAGKDGEHYTFGNDLFYADKKGNLHSYANFWAVTNEFGFEVYSLPLDEYVYTAPVKSFLPNDFGVYDMAGNVNEWTPSTYPEFADYGDINIVPDASPLHRIIIRGGSWTDTPCIKSFLIKKYCLTICGKNHFTT